MAVEVLPAVRGADEPAAEVLEWPAGGKAQRESPAARVSHSVIDPGTVCHGRLLPRCGARMSTSR